MISESQREHVHEHRFYKEYLHEVARVAPDILSLCVQFNLDERFPDLFAPINDEHRKIEKDFASDLIDEDKFRSQLMTLVPKIEKVYQICLTSLSHEAKDRFYQTHKMENNSGK